MGPLKSQTEQKPCPDQTWSKREVKKYDKKLNSMKKYAPFLGKVVRKLEKKKIKVRTKHLSAAKAFYSLLTESTVRLRLDNLTKLEKLLKDLYANKHKLAIYTRSESANNDQEKKKLLTEEKKSSRENDQEKKKLLTEEKKSSRENDGEKTKMDVSEKEKNNQSDVVSKEKSEATILCPVCKGFKINRSVDKCFGCDGDGKVDVIRAEDLWEMMFQLKCDPKVTLKNWPKPVTINCLPTVWKGNAVEIAVAQLRQEFWDQKLKEFKKKNEEKIETQVEVKKESKSDFVKERESKIEVRKSFKKPTRRSKNRRRVSNEKSDKREQEKSSAVSFTTFYPMSTQQPPHMNTYQPSSTPQDSNIRTDWSTTTKPMEAVLSPDASDLHLCPVCHGHSNLFNYGVCLACNGCRLLDRQTASNWWMRVMKNLSELQFAHEDCSLPYNLRAGELPTGWMGTAEQVNSAMVAQSYWQHAMSQWKWHANRALNPAQINNLPLLVATVSLQPSQEQHLVGLSPPSQAVPSIIMLPAYNAVPTTVNKKKGIMKKRILTNIPCLDISQSATEVKRVNKVEKKQIVDEFCQKEDDEERIESEMRENQILLCTFCRGNRYIQNNPCPACANQGMTPRAVAEKWWKKLYFFRTRFTSKDTPSDAWSLPNGIKWKDVPKNWRGEGTILEESLKLADVWEKEIKIAKNYYKKGQKKKNQAGTADLPTK